MEKLKSKGVETLNVKKLRVFMALCDANVYRPTWEDLNKFKEKERA